MVERDPVAGNHDARPEALVVRLDERDHHAARVGRAEIDGAAAMDGRRCGHARLAPVDAAREPVEPRWVEQRRDRRRHRRDIGDMQRDVREPELHRLDLQMGELGAVGR